MPSTSAPPRWRAPIARAQVVYGDILVLNKADLVEEQRLAEVEAELRAIKTDARILRACRGDVPLGLLLSVGLFESDRLAALQAQEEARDTRWVTTRTATTAMAMGITTITTSTTMSITAMPIPGAGRLQFREPGGACALRSSPLPALPRSPVARIPCSAPRGCSGSARANAGTCFTCAASASRSMIPTGPRVQSATPRWWRSARDRSGSHQDPARGLRGGAMSQTLLLSGPPGCGKTSWIPEPDSEPFGPFRVSAPCRLSRRRSRPVRDGGIDLAYLMDQCPELLI